MVYQHTMQETIRHNPPTLSPARNYTHVVVVASGRQVHISGQIAMNAAGATLADVFKVVTYVVGITPEKVAAVRAARAKFVGDGPFPASTMVGVTGLVHPDLLIEIEAIAAID